MITAPGIYTDVAAADYHADPLPIPSLTQSVAKILNERSPLHAWHCHPRLNPDWRPTDDRKFDVGNITHAMLIGRGKSIVVLDHDNWLTKEAKAKRAEYALEGKIAVLAKHNALASRMVTAAREQLELRGLGYLFRDGAGAGEVVLAWREGEIWLRQMVDWLTLDRAVVVDYKTTDMIAAPQCLPRMMVNANWPIQHAMAERGLDELDPVNAGRRKFLNVVQETEPPYCLNVVRMTERDMTMGRKQLERAIAMWRWCMATNRWPGYPTEILTLDYPGWAETQWLNREVEDDERRERGGGYGDVMMAG